MDFLTVKGALFKMYFTDSIWAEYPRGQFKLIWLCRTAPEHVTCRAGHSLLLLFRCYKTTGVWILITSMALIIFLCFCGQLDSAEFTSKQVRVFFWVTSVMSCFYFVTVRTNLNMGTTIDKKIRISSQEDTCSLTMHSLDLCCLAFKVQQCIAVVCLYCSRAKGSKNSMVSAKYGV